MRTKMTAPKPNSHNRATATHDIQCRVCFRQLQRISQRQQDDRSSQSHLSRYRRHVAEQSYRFQHTETADDSLLQPEAFVAKSLRPGDESADMLHVDGPVKEDLRNLDPAREMSCAHRSVAPLGERLNSHRKAARSYPRESFSWRCSAFPLP